MFLPALAPTAFVWEGLTTTNEPAGRSSWTRRGVPLAHVPFAEGPQGARPFASSGELHSASLRKVDAPLEAAAIRAEEIRAQVVLAAGEDDPVWPSAEAAERLSRRRSEVSLATTVLTHPEAGHRVLLPGEPFVWADPAWPMGGTEAADRELGARVLDALERLLGSR